MDFFLFDVTGGVFEYQITKPMGPNTTHSKARGALAARPELVGRFCVLQSCFKGLPRCGVLWMRQLGAHSVMQGIALSAQAHTPPNPSLAPLPMCAEASALVHTGL